MCRNNHLMVNKTPAEASKISDRLIAASDINNELSTINIHSTPSHVIVHAGALFLSKWDTENKELVVVGDLNCDVSKPLAGSHTQRLKFLCYLYQLEQFINEPTRVTSTSATLIDLILTNTPENILQSGVIHLGIVWCYSS